MIPQVAKLLAGVTALVIAITSLIAVWGGGSEPTPAVIIIRGSVLPDDGLTDSERDRESLREEQAQLEAVGGNGR